MVEIEISRQKVEESEHSDIDLDFDNDLKRMSLAAMSALDSITDEVNEIDRKSKGEPSSRSLSLGEHLHAIADKETSFAVTPSPEGKHLNIPHIDDLSLSDAEGDDMSLDLSMDGSLSKELDALRSVTREIERELSNQDSQTMQKAISNIENSDDPKTRILTSDDHEIIRKALNEEMENYEPKNAMERFLKRYHLEGITEQEKTYALATVCTFVWSIVFRLVYSVKFNEI